MTELSWLGVIRHGESMGNLAREVAEASGAEVIDLAQRDADVPLSPTGARQAEAVRDWLATLAPRERPEVVVSSPYRRAADTATIACGEPPPLDERLRDRELGVLDLLTSHGVQARFPAESVRREHLGKFYYRPPGGESWADVALRLRSFLADLRREHAGRRVLLFSHEAPVMLLRYLIEGLTEPELMALARRTPLANASLTSWERHGGVLRPAAFNWVAPVRERGVEPTEEEHEPV